MEDERAFSESGWGLRMPQKVSVENAWSEPPDGGEIGPTQFPLSHSAAAQVRKSGLAAVISFRDQLAIRLEGFGSISNDRASVKAWWVEDG